MVILELLVALMLLETVTLVVLEAIQDPLDNLAIQADPEIPVLLAALVNLAKAKPLLAKPSNHHHANLALLVHPVLLAVLANPATLVPMDNPDLVVETQLLDLLDQKDHLAHLETLVVLDNLATLVLQLKAKELLLDPLDHLAMLVLLANLVDLVNPETMDNPVDPDPKDHLAHLANLVNLETMDNLETPDKPEAQATRVSAPNIAPSTVVSSSKMEPGVKLAQESFGRKNILFFGCIILFNKIFI